MTQGSTIYYRIGSLEWYRVEANGDGTYNAPIFHGNAPIAGAKMHECNGDGLMDFSYLSGTSYQFRYSNGDGTFSSASRYVGPFTESPWGNDWVSTFLIDMNSDGYMDVIRHESYCLPMTSCTTVVGSRLDVHVNQGGTGTSWSISNVYDGNNYGTNYPSSIHDFDCDQIQDDFFARNYTETSSRFYFGGETAFTGRSFNDYLSFHGIGDVDMDGNYDYFVEDAKYYNFIGIDLSSVDEFYDLDLSVMDNIKVIDFDNDGGNEVTYHQDGNTYFFEAQLDGCVDETACNYEPDKVFDDGSCCFGICGCSDENAANYDASVECLIDVCEYEIQGIVFHDLNGDGIQDDDEPVIPNIQIEIESEELFVWTNDSGAFSFPQLPLEGIELSIASQMGLAQVSNPESLSNWEGTDNSSLAIGLISGNVVNPQAQFGIYSFTPGFLCNTPVQFQAYLTNDGVVPTNNVIRFSAGSVFNSLSFSQPEDSLVDGSYYFNVNNLQPFQGVDFTIFGEVGGVEQIGEFGNVIMECITQNALNEDLETSGIHSSSGTVVCAYDPNDIQVSPEGITEMEYLPVSQQVEYTIRFQNTGTAPATNVVIVDTLADELNDTQLQILHASHPVQTSYDADSRRLVFTFEDINLPDSTCCFDESMGFVTYSIKTPSWHERYIPSRAFIYFDQNPPIETNTLHNHTFSCTSAIEYEESNVGDCVGDSTTIEIFEHPLVDVLYWTWQSDTIYLDNPHVIDTLLTDTPGESQWLRVHLTGPTCTTASRSFIQSFDELPDIPIQIPEFFFACPNESLDLDLPYSGSFKDYQWNDFGWDLDTEYPVTLGSDSLIFTVRDNNDCYNTRVVPVITSEPVTLFPTDSLSLCPYYETYDLESLYPLESYYVESGDFWHDFNGSTHSDGEVFNEWNLYGSETNITDYAGWLYVESDLIGECDIVDSIYLAPFQEVAFDVLPDYTDPVCQGDDFVLSTTLDQSVYWIYEQDTIGSGTHLTYSIDNHTSPVEPRIYASHTDQNGCTYEEVILVDLHSLGSSPLLFIMTPFPAPCAGDTILLRPNMPINNGFPIFYWDELDIYTDSVMVVPTEPTHYFLNATFENGCERRDSILYTPQPLPELSIEGPESICLGEEATLLLSGDPSAIWLDQPGESMLTVSPSASAMYVAEATSNGGCYARDSIGIEVNMLPSLIVSGDSAGCSGESIDFMAISDGTVTWNGSSPSEVFSLPLIENTELIAEATTPEGCTADTLINILVHPLPSLEISGDTDVCEGELVSLSASSDGEVTWDGSTDGNSFEVLISEDLEIIAEATTPEGCVTETIVQTNMLALPTAEIDVLGNLLTASEGSSYAWFLNGELIEGADQQSYTIQETGDYSVEVTNDNDCANTSSSSFVTYVGINEWESSAIAMFPNPSDGTLNFSHTLDTDQVLFYDNTGRLVQDQTVRALKETELPLADGMYLVKILRKGTAVFSERLIVKK